MHQRVRMGRTVLQQRSGRRRLYDHNLFLRALFRDRIIHNKLGSLGPKLKGAVFVDIGSAILYGEGAPTLRDVYEDRLVRPHLSTIIATDINDRSRWKTRYIDIYRRLPKRRRLPFPVREVPMLVVHPDQVRRLSHGLLKEKDTPLIFRSTSAGPDLYYTVSQAERHLAAVLAAHQERTVMYLFNKFILLKHADRLQFEILGEIDPRVGLWHHGPVWRRINWRRRSVYRAFRPNPNYARIVPSKKKKHKKR